MSDNKDMHGPLRDNVRLLGDALGMALREHGGELLFDEVEAIRRLSRDARAGRAAAAALAGRLDQLDGPALLQVVRAFSQFLNLANIAEQHHRVRMRGRAGPAVPDVTSGAAGGTFAALGEALRGAGIAPSALAATLRSVRVELVLTAHPTEVTRRTLMHKYDAIAGCLAALDRAPADADQVRGELQRLVAGAWHTDEIRHTQPTPVDEAKWGFATIEQTLWQAVPQFLRELDRWMRGQTGEPLPLDVSPVRFASWMGGDRDGNPRVTHAVTREVILLARWQAAELFLRDVELLLSDLSMHEADDALLARTGRVAEPYRALLKPLRERLRNTRNWAEAQLDGREPPALPIIESDADLREPMQLAWNSLVNCGLRRIADGPLADTLRRVAAFGAMLVRLDIRQESSRHADALAAITGWLGVGDYNAWDEAARQAFLIAELDSRRPLFGDDFLASAACSVEVRETLATFRGVARAPNGALGGYVISMAHAASDVLAVLLLQKTCGVQRPLPVVPLFETLDDLEHAAGIVDALFSMPAYMARIGGYQQVMIGYSDSAKDAGYLAASWAQYRAQEALTRVCARHGVRLELFHGRGGSISRGGTPTRQALLSQPPGSVNGRLRVTEQGEMIRFKFGLLGVAVENLELYVASTLEATLLPPVSPAPHWRALMDELTAVSVGGYREIVRDEPRFVEYMRTVTPEPELATLALGSRPARRRASGGLESLRAIPWVFAWTQIRLMLPAWLGTGTALAWLRESPPRQEVFADMLAQWPYFQAVIDMLEMVLAKAEPDIAAHYESRLAGEDLRPLGEVLRASYADTVHDLLALTGRQALLENNPVMQWSIAVRNPYADPLHLLQAELIRRHRAGGAGPAIDQALKVTIAGIAAGMRNTG